MRNYSLFSEGVRAVVVFSAHYEADAVRVAGSERTYGTLYDFVATELLPPAVFKVRYPARTEPQLGAAVEQRLREAGIE